MDLEKWLALKVDEVPTSTRGDYGASRVEQAVNYLISKENPQRGHLTQIEVLQFLNLMGIERELYHEVPGHTILGCLLTYIDDFASGAKTYTLRVEKDADRFIYNAKVKIKKSGDRLLILDISAEQGVRKALNDNREEILKLFEEMPKNYPFNI